MKDVVVALRMEFSDAVIDQIQSGIEHAVEEVVKKAFFGGRETVSKSEIGEQVANYFRQPLDEDGNTLLHYAVYYEGNDAIGAIYYLAATFEILSEVFLKENLHRMIPLDFAKCCLKDSSFPDRMKTYTDAAREDLSGKKLLPSLKKAARRLWGVICNANFEGLIRPANFIGSYLIGTRLFGRSRITSFVFAGMPPFTGLSTDELNELYDYCKRPHATTLFVSHLVWRFHFYLFSFIPRKLFLLSIPVVVATVIFFKSAGRTRKLIQIGCLPLVFTFTPLFILFDSLERFIILPSAIKRDSQFERSAVLLIFAVVFVLGKWGVGFYSGVANDEFVAEDAVLVDEECDILS